MWHHKEASVTACTSETAAVALCALQMISYYPSCVVLRLLHIWCYWCLLRGCRLWFSPLKSLFYSKESKLSNNYLNSWTSAQLQWVWILHFWHSVSLFLCLWGICCLVYFIAQLMFVCSYKMIFNMTKRCSSFNMKTILSYVGRWSVHQLTQEVKPEHDGEPDVND